MSRSATARQLDQLLSVRGFSRRNLTWNRRSGEFVDVVDLQVSKSADSVTVNTGVFHPAVYRRCWGEEPPSIVHSPHCTVTTRIGELTDEGDVWWELDRETTPAGVASAVETYVLPFLDRLSSPAAMADFLEASNVVQRTYPPPIICLALLRHDLGDPTLACRLLHDLERRSIGSAWPAKVRSVARELGCAPVD